MKKHILTIRNGTKLYTFLVEGRTGEDGKTRISWTTYNECVKLANVQRGHCIQIG